jgi:di/tricarboxylate transporter
MIIGALFSLIDALERYGGLEIITTWLFEYFPANINTYIVIVLFVSLTAIFNLFIPNISVCVAFLVSLFTQLSLEIGVNPIIAALVTTMTVDSVKFYPTQSTPLLMVYDRKSFQENDVFQTGLAYLFLLILVVLFIAIPYWQFLGV